MKITIIHGSPRKGNTYHAAQLFKGAMQGQGEAEFVEFTLPKAMPNFCRSCMTCFLKGEEHCPDAAYTLPILEAMLESEGLIFSTPVYALGASAAMKAFLDHYAFMFLVHRARPEMFAKKAFVLSTTAGGGTGSAIKTIATSLKFWGVNRVYSGGFALHALDWESMPKKRRKRFESKIGRQAKRFHKALSPQKKRRPTLQTRVLFSVMRQMVKKQEDGMFDKQYWQEQNWFERNPF